MLSPCCRSLFPLRCPLREITDIADNQIKKRLENIDGVGEIRITGGRRREIRVRVDPDKMSAYGLTVNDVANALRLQNLELPGGRVNEGARELTVRAMGRITDPKDFSEIAIASSWRLRGENPGHRGGGRQR